jgi:hypothetical protein
MNHSPNFSDKFLGARFRDTQRPGRIMNRGWPAVIDFDRVRHIFIIVSANLPSIRFYGVFSTRVYRTSATDRNRLRRGKTRQTTRLESDHFLVCLAGLSCAYGRFWREPTGALKDPVCMAPRGMLKSPLPLSLQTVYAVPACGNPFSCSRAESTSPPHSSKTQSASVPLGGL